MTNPTPTEIELKLALPPEHADGFRKRMARRHCTPVKQALITHYFDTPDFALSGRGVALRVRRVGRRWLQTLKTEGERRGGLSQRIEHEMPITRGSPDWSRFPEEAQALVPEPLRAQLVPVFETRFERTAWLLKGKGGALIEVALDQGEVRAGDQHQPLCEIELELKSGQPDALFEMAQGWARQFDCVPLDISKAERGVRLALGWKAEPVKSRPVRLSGEMTVEDSFAVVVQACLGQFQANLPGVMASDDIEYVHQARVSLRRLRAALRLYRRACPLPDDLKDGLHELAAALGPARDWDVLCCETLPAMAPFFDDAQSWQRGMEVLEARRAAVRSGMRSALSRAHPGAWLLACQRWLLQRGWRVTPAEDPLPEARRLVQLSPLKQWSRRAMHKGHRSMVRTAQEFESLSPARRHALRVAFKRQRYAAEFFQPLHGGRRQKRYLAALRDVLDAMGRAQDVQAARTLLGETSNLTGPAGQFALGWLSAHQAEGCPREFMKQLKNFIKLSPYW